MEVYLHMALQDQFSMARLAIKPLAYENKDLAQRGEFMVDHAGEHPTYHLYIVDPEDETKIIDITSYMVKEAFGNSITSKQSSPIVSFIPSKNKGACVVIMN